MAARGKKLIKVRRRAEAKHRPTNIHRNDRVQIVAGNEKGTIGKVLTVLPARQRVVIEGANKRFKHVRKSQQNPQGGRVEREAPVPISNVLLYCESCDRGVRVRTSTDGDKKVRVCAKCGAQLG